MMLGEPMSTSPKFTLRFYDSSTHELLGMVAHHLGVSKNQLAEEMLARELGAASLLLEQDLTGTIELLRNYRAGEHLSADIEAVAHAEAYEHDPLRSRRKDDASYDVYDIAGMFASS
jgi:hypothetical protein